MICSKGIFKINKNARGYNMNFKNPRYITKGVSENVSLLLQLFMALCQQLG